MRLLRNLNTTNTTRHISRLLVVLVSLGLVAAACTPAEVVEPEPDPVVEPEPDPEPDPELEEEGPYKLRLFPRRNRDPVSSYTILLSNFDTGEKWWDAPYRAFLPSGAGWIDGDRTAYNCAYGFLIDDGWVVGRFTFARVPGVSYAKVSDRFMPEGNYYYDASPTPYIDDDSHGQAYPPRWCADSLVSQEYEPDTRPGQTPVVEFHNRGRVIETRDYRDVEVLTPGLKFHLVEVTGPFLSDDGEGRVVEVTSRTTVVAYFDDLPVIVVYYDGIGTGFVTAEIP